MSRTVQYRRRPGRRSPSSSCPAPLGRQIVYLASPGGRSPSTPFRLVRSTPGPMHEAVFENPDHDFPNRIIYRLSEEEGVLTARIEGKRDVHTQSQDWTMKRPEMTADSPGS